MKTTTTTIAQKVELVMIVGERLPFEEWGGKGGDGR